MVEVKSFKMGHGPDMPGIAYGTWQIPADVAGNLVSTALEVGYKHIDCAYIYQNEESIGHTFAKLKNREELFIVSKLWGNSHQPELVKPAYESTVKNLKCGYLDLYLVHNPCRMGEGLNSKWFSKEWILETWRAMEKLYEGGLVKAIGVSNFSTTKLGWLLDEATVKPANNQVELHPYLPQNKLHKFCKENNILLSAYSTLGTPGTAINFPQFVDDSKPVLLKDPVVNQIAKKNNLTPAQVLLNWGYNRGTPVLCKSSSKERMIENLNMVNLNLSEDDVKTLNNLATKCRYCDFTPFCGEHDVQEFWDGELYN